MGPHFLISGAGGRVGKTMAGCALAFAFKVRGMRVGVMKPVQTGCPESGGALVSEDAASMLAAASSDLPMELACRYRYRSPLAPAAAAEADGLPPPDFTVIERDYREIAASSDATLVEDTGGIAAPLEWNRNYGDLALSLGLEMILIVANRQDFIAAGALSIGYAALRGIAVRGFILNALDRDSSVTVARDAAMLARASGARCLGTVRFKEPLALNIVEQLL
jgi:dethiobiotin synthetase